ncbi:MetQ/NlpA family ABC transporter substrate-binding protein [Corynebacterium ulceribovis]|uniref:MetQ/NlpA family ABC transporter substrate-binding protein n=1 Tax=Corynebacterium ulceribovis TaxID=487732 RepID=UPI0003720D46|nr:MetQ/NlpA family ABC transporter substrate-binding protein [Corynebacterium ulceribovis]
MNLRRVIAATTATAFATITLTACGGSDEDTIKIGTTDADKLAWSTFEKEAKDAGIKLEVVNYSDYNTPNRALSEGQIDINLFQHIKFLADYNVGSNANIIPIGSTEIVPLALYYKDHTSLDDIKQGDEVIIPNDVTNQGRALNLLADNGLVTLKDNAPSSPAPVDVDEAKSKVKVVAVDAAQTATTWGEGKPAVVNNTYLERASIDPATAIAKDDPNSKTAEPFINVFATTEEKKDTEGFTKLIEIWHSQPVQDAVQEDSGGTSIAVDRPANELQEILDREEKELAEAK